MEKISEHIPIKKRLEHLKLVYVVKSRKLDVASVEIARLEQEVCDKDKVISDYIEKVNELNHELFRLQNSLTEFNDSVSGKLVRIARSWAVKSPIQAKILKKLIRIIFNER